MIVLRNYIILLSLVVLFVPGCSRWQVSQMASRKVLEVAKGTEPGKVELPLDERGITNLSLNVAVAHDSLVIADNTLKRVQVLDMNGNPQLVVGNVEGIAEKNYPLVPFTFSVIGQVTLDREGLLYIQNRVQPKNTAGQDVPLSSDFSPSYVLVFTDNGELLHTLGSNGSPDIPFYYIENFQVDDTGRLFVVSRSFDTWTVYRFSGTRRDFLVNLGKLGFSETRDEETYTGRIEQVAITSGGEQLYISVAYYHNKRFKYRKIHEYIIPEAKLGKVLVTLQDPKNVLFSLQGDREMYFWDMLEGETRFMITDLTGKRLKTTRIGQPSAGVFYSRVFAGDSGNIYSYTITKNGINLYSWE